MQSIIYVFLVLNVFICVPLVIGKNDISNFQKIVKIYP